MGCRLFSFFSHFFYLTVAVFFPLPSFLPAFFNLPGLFPSPDFFPNRHFPLRPSLLTSGRSLPRTTVTDLCISNVSDRGMTLLRLQLLPGEGFPPKGLCHQLPFV